MCEAPWHCVCNTVVKGSLAFLKFLLLLSIGHTIQVYTMGGSPKISWTYSIEKNYTKPLSPVFPYYAVPFPKGKSSRARAASFFSPRLGQRRWRLVTGSDVFWVHQVKTKDENMKLWCQ